MNIVLEYIVSLVPTIIALIGEIAVIAKAISVFKKSKESDEYKKLCEQNEILVAELRETKKLNREYLTKIDKIARGEND